MRRRLVLLVVVAALAFGVAACGGDDDDGGAVGPSGSSGFCGKATAVDRQFNDLDTAGTAGVPSRDVLLKAATSVDSLAVSAPTAVRGDLQTVAGGVRQIADLLGQVDLNDQAALDDPKNAPKLEQVSAAMERFGNQVQAASARVAKYLHDRCGIDTGTTTSSTTTPTTAATTTTLG